MQTSKLRPFYQLAAVTITRTASIDTTVVNSTNQLKAWKDIPGPSSLPILGQTHHFFPGGELYSLSLPQLGEHLCNKYGPIVRFDELWGKPLTLFLFDAEQSAKLLHSENWLPIRPGFNSLIYYRKKYKRSNETACDLNGLLTDHGEPWKQFRSIVNPVLMKPKTIKLYNAMIDEVALDMIARFIYYFRLKSLRGNNNKIQSDFDMEMNLWSLESIALVALGRRLRCFDSHLPQNSPEKRLIKVVHDIFKSVEALDFKPSLWKYYPTKAYRRAMKSYEEQEILARYFIDKTIEELNVHKRVIAEDKKSVLEKLLEINKDIAVVMATDALLAGVDTTSNTIIGALYLLANNQDKQDALREKIRSVTDENEKRPYLKACLKESMRMMPITVGNARVSTKEYDMLGYQIPTGVEIIMMHQTMAMMEKNYPRPTKYIPERWLVNKDDPLHHGNAHPFAYQPFGFGVRTCIGRRIAELEMETFLKRLIENFKIEWFGPPATTRSAGLNYVNGPYNFIFKDL
ncbi:unnamed protein product [Diatraea saccharalis]|uniref:Cytochrome P450 n=1 Tax=Diatraea saccharalis TaxID=40085 RepID=A0A9N9R8T7_9NEOP|nr:unnamed protein product [Diatraea saccharalis]